MLKISVLFDVGVPNYLGKKKSNLSFGTFVGWYDINAKNQDLKDGSNISLLRMWLKTSK